MLMPSTPLPNHKFVSPFASPSLQYHQQQLRFNDYAESYHTCGGLLHIEPAALLVAFISTLMNLLYLVGFVLSEAFQHQVWWCNASMLVLSVVLVWGQRARSPKFYLAYLLGNAVSVLLKAGFLFVLLTFIAVLDPDRQEGAHRVTSGSKGNAGEQIL